MRVHVCAVGRARPGPERALIDDYAARFDRTGRALGLGPLRIHEVEDRKGGGAAAEAALLERTIPKGARLVALDERGEVIGSPAFADRLAGWRDDGCSDLAFVIGGADGLARALRAGRSRAVIRADGLAAHARAGDARRTALPRRVDPRGQPLSQGLISGPDRGLIA